MRGIPEIQNLDFGKYVPEFKQEVEKPLDNVWNKTITYTDGDIVFVGTQGFRCTRKHVSTDDNKPGINNWEPVNLKPVTLPKSTVQGKLQSLLKNKSPIGTYYQSWSSPWVSNGENLDLSKIESPINIVNISFCDPNCTYKKGSNSFSGTGVQFSSEFQVVKKSIEILKNRGVIVMLSVGGASYQFTTYNAQNIADLCNDLGCDGIDIDWEDEHGFERFGSLISETRRVLPEGCISTAGFSVGAYGENQFKNSPPQSSRTGMNIQGLKSDGEKLDWINIMTYDASPLLDPIEAFKAYRSFYKGPLLIGAEVPPEAWGGNVITLEKVTEHAKYVASQGKENGIFTWSYQKQGTPNSKDILDTASKVLI
jgi:chitinase